MSSFDQNSFKNLQKLCRIKCTKEEEQELHKDLQKIIKYIEQLNELNTENIAPIVNIANLAFIFYLTSFQ